MFRKPKGERTACVFRIHSDENGGKSERAACVPSWARKRKKRQRRKKEKTDGKKKCMEDLV